MLECSRGNFAVVTQESSRGILGKIAGGEADKEATEQPVMIFVVRLLITSRCAALVPW